MTLALGLNGEKPLDYKSLAKRLGTTRDRLHGSMRVIHEKVGILTPIFEESMADPSQARECLCRPSDG